MIWHDTIVAPLFVVANWTANSSVWDVSSNMIASFATTRTASITARKKTK